MTVLYEVFFRIKTKPLNCEHIHLHMSEVMYFMCTWGWSLYISHTIKRYHSQGHYLGDIHKRRQANSTVNVDLQIKVES